MVLTLLTPPRSIKTIKTLKPTVKKITMFCNQIPPHFDLIALIERDLGPGKRSGRWTLWRCPFHDDHHPSFAVTNGNGELGPGWRCFSASCGKHGGPVKWLMEYRGMEKREALDALNLGDIPASSRARRPAFPAPKIDRAPGAKWQARAQKLIERARDALWKAKDPIPWPHIDPATGGITWREMSPLEFLIERGLTASTVRFWHIGYIPKGFWDASEAWGLKGEKIWIPRGILIPCVIAGQVWYLKIRRPKPKPRKYIQIAGSRPAVFMVQTLENRTQAVFCEGELDALLLWQEADDLAGVVSLGSAGSELNVATWGLHLLHVRERFIAYDLDASGETGAAKLDWLAPQRLAAPQLQPQDKDITDFWKSGGDVRAWLQEHLAEPGQKHAI